MKFRKAAALILALIMALSLAACAGGGGETTDTSETEESSQEANGDVVILFTSDIHCGVSDGLTLEGLEQMREAYEKAGCTVILVDDGDAVQGEPLGTLTSGESMISLMNDMRYDVAIPGNHEFDYGMEQFMKLVEMADFPYISCNFNKEGELVFEPYKIIEAGGMKIAFVGVTTPTTITSSTPKYFQDDEGNYIYGFLQEDETGEALYSAVQNAIDSARAEGADYVYVMGHLGLNEEAAPWRYSDVIEHTTGIDVFLDGHSHDTEQVVMKDKDGRTVVRSAPGTKLNCIGYSRIIKDRGILETNIISWPNAKSAEEVFYFENPITQKVQAEYAKLAEILYQEVATITVDLTINDPNAKDASGNPIRMVRRAETNMGDFCADALRDAGSSDIAVIGGGAVRADIPAGSVTFNDILSVFPFGNELLVVEASGQQIMDTLEWGAKEVPSEFGSFIQVSGLTYEIDVNVESTCTQDENGMFTGVAGERRVKNIMVGGKPIDPEGTYTVCGAEYLLTEYGDGNTGFMGAEIIRDKFIIDNQALINYFQKITEQDKMGDYADPYGDGRITIIE